MHAVIVICGSLCAKLDDSSQYIEWTANSYNLSDFNCNNELDQFLYEFSIYTGKLY